MSKKILFTNPVPLIEQGISWGFRQNGWDVYIMYGEDFKDGQLNGIKKYVEERHVDYIYWDFGAGTDYKAIYEYCQSKGVGFIIHGIEDTPTMSCWLDQCINYCDYYLTTTYEMINYAKIKYNKDIHLFMFGVNPDYHRPAKPNQEKYNCDIALVANNYSSRYDDFNIFVSPLINNNYNINIWGNEWWLQKNKPVNLCLHPNVYKGYIGNHETQELYSTCKIGLGLQCNRESYSPKSSQFSMRFGEIMGVGNAIFISPWSVAQENYLGKSGEYAFFPKTGEEMVDNVNMILNMSDKERKDFALRSQKFVYENHSYKDKVAEVIKIIGG